MCEQLVEKHMSGDMLGRGEGGRLESRHTARTFTLHAALHAPRDVQIVFIGTVLLNDAAQSTGRVRERERERVR